MAEKSVPDFFVDQFFRRAIDLRKHELAALTKMLGVIETSADEVRNRIHAFRADGADPRKFSVARLNALLKNLTEISKNLHATQAKLLRSDLLEIGRDSDRWLRSTVNKAVKFSAMSVGLTAKDLEKIVDDGVFFGNPLKEHFQTMDERLRSAFAREVRLGLAQGQTNDELVRRLIGTATGPRQIVEIDGKMVKVPVRTGGVLPNLSKRDATTLVRTTVQGVSNAVIDETYKENADVLKGREAIATLDLRTSKFCIAIDGTRWDLEGNLLPDSPTRIPFPGPPPWHPNCRSTLLPILKSWAEIIESETGKKFVLDEKGPDFDRASMNGPVAGKTNIEDWFRSLPESDQMKYLGKGVQKLWREGKISRADFLDALGRERSLKELLAKVEGEQGLTKPAATIAEKSLAELRKEFVDYIEDSEKKDAALDAWDAPQRTAIRQWTGGNSVAIREVWKHFEATGKLPPARGRVTTFGRDAFPAFKEFLESRPNLPEEVVLYRGMKTRAGVTIADLTSAESITFDTPTSWSTVPMVARQFTASGMAFERAVYEIRTKKAVPVSATPGTGYSEEFEYVLRPGAKFRVLSVDANYATKQTLGAQWLEGYFKSSDPRTLYGLSLDKVVAAEDMNALGKAINELSARSPLFESTVRAKGIDPTSWSPIGWSSPPYYGRITKIVLEEI